MKTRVAIECRSCDAEISHFSEQDVIALAEESRWRKFPHWDIRDPQWHCPMCVKALQEEAKRRESIVGAKS